MILGISASGRSNGITSKTVKEVLKSSGVKYEYVSLSGKRINGCMGCLKCAKDNVCKMKDDWNEIGNKMIEADAIVFGAPNYRGNINALGHACLERTFCFKHRERINLAGKFGIIVSVQYARETSDIVFSYIRDIMSRNMMVIVDSVAAIGYSHCYTCGYGESCGIGNVVKDHGFITKIESKHYPLNFEKQYNTQFQAHRAGRILGSILKEVSETKHKNNCT